MCHAWILWLSFSSKELQTPQTLQQKIYIYILYMQKKSDLERELKQVYHFKYLGSVHTRELKMRIAMAKEACNRIILLLTSKLNIELRKKKK